VAGRIPSTMNCWVANRRIALCDLVEVPRALGGYLGLSAGWDQFFESVAIQRLASSSVAKFPTCETGAYPVLTATVQRPSLIIFE
jgi:hypothetical protein